MQDLAIVQYFSEGSFRKTAGCRCEPLHNRKKLQRKTLHNRRKLQSRTPNTAQPQKVAGQRAGQHMFSDGNHGFVSIESGGRGSGSVSTAYTVMDDRPYEVPVYYADGSDWTQGGEVSMDAERGYVTCYTNDFDSGYHRWFYHALHFDPSAGAFVEDASVEPWERV